MDYRKREVGGEVEVVQYRVDMWECKDESSIFFGNHDTGTVKIPVGHFKDEQMEEWIKDGRLTVVE